MLNKIIILLLFQLSFNMMVFPFKLAKEHKNGLITEDSKEYNGSHFGADYFNTKIYFEMKIGDPIQPVKILLTSDTCAFKIGKSKRCIYSDEYLSYYNRNKSDDFSYTPGYSVADQEFYNEKGCTALDTIYAYTDLKLEKETKFRRVGFYLGSDTNDKLCGYIGLEFDNILCEKMFNIVKHCKSKNYINNYKFMMKYNNINEGLFIIGGELKDVIDNYDERKNFVSKLSEEVTMNKWGVDVNKIILGDKNHTIEKEIPAQINNDFTFIILDSKYLTHFNNSFFLEYFNKGICKIALYDNNPEYKYLEKYNVIECDKDKFGENDLKKFPILYIYVADYYKEKKLNFDGKDLFTETKYKYFFNIIFDLSPRNKIELGKIFLQKYTVNFNIDNKMLEIYDYQDYNDEKGEDEESFFSKNKIIFYIIIIVILFAITGVVGYFLGKYLNNLRKKRANELVDDEYVYNPETKEPINS